MLRLRLLSLLAIAALALSGCGNPESAADDEGSAPPVAGMCAPDMPDCVDTVVEPDAGADGSAEPTEGEPGAEPVEGDADADPSAADDLIGVAEDELDPSVRIARRGDETFALTEDYVVGRLTVELDADSAGVYRVTKATLERAGGPYTAEG